MPRQRSASTALRGEGKRRRRSGRAASCGASPGRGQWRPGTQVWVREDERGGWVPGFVCDGVGIDAEVLQCLGAQRDVVCIQLYGGSNADVYPITDPTSDVLRPIDWAVEDSDGGGAALSAGVAANIMQLAREDRDRKRAQAAAEAAVFPPTTPAVQAPPRRSAAAKKTPRRESEDERRLAEYLRVLRGNSECAEQVADVELALALLSTTSGAQPVAQKMRGEGDLRSLQTTGNGGNSDAALVGPPTLMPETPETRLPVGTRNSISAPQQLPHPPPPPPPPPAAVTPTSPTITSVPRRRPTLDALQHVGRVDTGELDAIRHRIASSHDASELSPLGAPVACLNPTFRLRNVIGALPVVGVPCRTTVGIPQRDAHRSISAETHRVLVVALGSAPTYDPESGWMEPLELEDGSVEMSVSVGGREFVAPPNWRLPPRRSFDGIRGVKALIPIDVTSAVQLDHFNSSRGELEELDLGVHFGTSASLAELQLWCGTIALLLVDVIPPAAIARDIEQQFVPPSRLYKVDSSCLRTCVSLMCPLSSLPLRRPCRGMDCEHFQCMELDALLATCLRRHVWACPLCHAPVPVSSIAIDERLLRLLSTLPRSTRGPLPTVSVSFTTTGDAVLSVNAGQPRDGDLALRDSIDVDD